jgi:hypothetical protein
MLSVTPRPDHSSTLWILKALSPGLYMHVPSCTDMYNSSVLHHMHVPSYCVQVDKLTTYEPHPHSSQSLLNGRILR